MTPDKLGWILIHSHAHYPGGNYATPQEELQGEYEPEMPWNWKLGRPLKEGGPYTLLFAWEGEIFGEGTAEVTHAVELTRFNFAFKLNDYKQRKPVALADSQLGLGNRAHSHRSLIKLDQQVLDAYHRLVGQA